MPKILLEIDLDRYKELLALCARLPRIAGHVEALRNPLSNDEPPVFAEGNLLCRINLLLAEFHVIPSPNLLGSNPPPTRRRARVAVA